MAKTSVNSMRPGPVAADEPYVIAEPHPSALIESLRAFGYNTEAAVADLIDNSISAGARNLWVDFSWNGEDSLISIRDDGRGMTGDELTAAMRPGSRSPLEERDPSDLGRFGLGLKTATFSQCRELTVASRSARGSLAVRRWDLDYVGASAEWRLLTTPATGTDAALAGLPGSGTVVIWSRLDRVVGRVSVDDAASQDRFLQVADRVRAHLAMTFHRFLDRPRRVTMRINGVQVRPWDPFMVSEPATQVVAEEPLRLHGHKVTVKGYVLPHRSKLTAPAQQEGAGIRGWNAHQGFYVYRSNRILVAGDWLGLGFQREEHCKLARLALDLSNDLDDDWQIDVKKSTARPPGPLVADLRKLAKITRDRAQEVYRHRGKVISRRAAADYVFAWEQLSRHGKVRYQINRRHPVVSGVLDTSKDQRERLERLLTFIEETVPVPLIGLSLAQATDEAARPYEGVPSRELAAVLRETFASLIAKGRSPSDAIDQLAATEPFSSYPGLIAQLAEEQAVDM